MFRKYDRNGGATCLADDGGDHEADLHIVQNLLMKRYFDDQLQIHIVYRFLGNRSLASISVLSTRHHVFPSLGQGDKRPNIQAVCHNPYAWVVFIRVPRFNVLRLLKIFPSEIGVRGSLRFSLRNRLWGNKRFHLCLPYLHLAK